MQNAITVDEFFYGAYRDAGLVLLEQTGLNADQTEEARQLFNRLIDTLQLDGDTISHVARILFPITPDQGDYTLGAGGDWDPTTGGVGESGTSSLNAYPVRVERASMVLTTQSTPGSGPPEYPIWPLTIDEWQSWTLKQQTTNWPRRYFYEPDFPLATFHLLFVPTDSNQIALYLEQTLTEISATGDELLLFRPGYLSMLQTNMAKFIAARKPGSNISPFILEEARSSLQLIKSTNDRPLKRPNDMLGSRFGRSSVYDGNRYSR